jgi:transposase-like protein
MATTSKEARMVMALEAFKNNEGSSVQAIARIYDVSPSTMTRRLHGVKARRDLPPKSKKLAVSEEKVLLKYILDLDARAFPPRLSGVEEMANILLHDRGGGRVGKRWAMNFVKRQPQLKTRYTRRYDYQRKQTEDPKLIGEWFNLVQDMKVKQHCR